VRLRVGAHLMHRLAAPPGEQKIAAEVDFLDRFDPDARLLASIILLSGKTKRDFLQKLGARGELGTSSPSTTLLSSAVPQIRSPAASSIQAPWPRTERRRASTSPAPSTPRATAASLLCGTCRSSCTSHRYLAPLRRASRRQHRPDYGQGSRLSFRVDPRRLASTS